MSVGMAWLMLTLACFCEIGNVGTMKLTKGYTKIIPTAANILLMFGSIFFCAKAVTVLSVGSAYAIWTACGAAGAVIIGIVFYRESPNPKRLLCVAVVVAGIIGLNLCS